MADTSGGRSGTTDFPTGPTREDKKDAGRRANFEAQLAPFLKLLTGEGGQQDILLEAQQKYLDISEGNDHRFDAFRQSRLNQLAANEQGQLGGASEMFDRRGTGGSTASLNAQNRIRSQFDLSRNSVTAETGLQQMGRQDRALESGLDVGQTAVQNLLAPITAELGFQSTEAARKGGGGGGGGGISVICTLLYDSGDLPDGIYMRDQEYGANLSSDIIEGYHWWALPLVGLMRRQMWLYRLVRPIARRWAVGVATRDIPWWGKAGEKMCEWLGVALRRKRALKLWRRYGGPTT